MPRPHSHSFCPDCDDTPASVSRRQFLMTAGAAVAVAGAVAGAVPIVTAPTWAVAKAAPAAAGDPESLVKVLYESLKDNQRQRVCFNWDHMDPKLGLLRTRVSNNWHITEPEINSDFYTGEQQKLVRSIFEGIIQPDWHARIDKQLEDDAGGFGNKQNIAIFGKPGDGKFELVMTGRHMTLRCDGNSADHVAFGGPIFYGHAAEGFNEGPTHPGNVFWPQALLANDLYKMLDGKQRDLALVKQEIPKEEDSGFRGKGAKFDGIPATELSSDQKAHLEKVLAKLIEPYRQGDRDEALACLKTQGGLDACSLAFYGDEQADIGKDGVWDCWRLEGPSFVWYFRGTPHVHVWANIADNPAVKLNAGRL